LPATVEDGIGPLLALRECIEGAIGQLLRLRPVQEQAKGRDKIISIGRQCSNSPAAVFEHIADDIHKINDELSGAKRASYSREQMLELFNRALSALVALLSNVDKAKLRRS
jgi:fatty acid-binding protein DegV